jgi:ADP-ribosylglycohydrolase
VARESSLATHPGQLAADACDFAAYVISRAIRRGAGRGAVRALLTHLGRVKAGTRACGAVPA